MFVFCGAISGKVIAFIISKVGVFASLVIAPGGTQHSRPGKFYCEISLYMGFGDFFAFLRKQHWLYSRKGKTGIGRLKGHKIAHGRDHDSARFGLPPGIDYRTFTFADVDMIPLPCLTINWFAHATEKFEGVESVAEHMIFTMCHKCTNGGRRCIKLTYRMLIADLPESTRPGISRHTFVHHRGGAI